MGKPSVRRDQRLLPRSRDTMLIGWRSTSVSRARTKGRSPGLCEHGRLPQGTTRAGEEFAATTIFISTSSEVVTARRGPASLRNQIGGFGHPGASRRTLVHERICRYPLAAGRMIGNSIKHDCSHVCSKDAIPRQLRTFAAQSNCCELDSGEHHQSAPDQEWLVVHLGSTKGKTEAARSVATFEPHGR